MKKSLKITGIIVVVMITGVIGFIMGSKTHRSDKENQASNSVYISDIKMPPEMYLSDFTEINNIVRENYSHLDSKNLNPDSLYSKYSQRIKNISTKEEYGKILLEYFAELNNSHTAVYFKRYYMDCSAVLVDGRVFVDEAGASFIHKGINNKDEIIAIDHIPVSEWVNQQQKFISASTDADRMNRSAWRIFSSYFEGDRTFLFKTPTGEKEITLSFSDDDEIVTSAVIRDSIGYIAINSMMGEVVDKFKKEYEKVHDKPILIIDLRANGGGNSGNSEEIARYLIRQKQPACVFGNTLVPSDNHYKGKLIVLIGTDTFSAAESFALDLKESGNAVFIGSPTGGDTGNHPENFTTQQGISFRIPTRKPAQVSPKGFPMEGQGIEPDYVIHLTVEDYLNKVDPVLEYAIRTAIY
jgi:carboxyl-terminal processing protease